MGALVRKKMRRLLLRRSEELFKSGKNCSAVGMAENDNEGGAESLNSELDAADLGGRDNVAGDANDKEVTKALVKDDFGGDARVRAAKDNRERLLAPR